MSRKERLIAALLLGVAVAGGALIPRLLASPPTSLGIALGPGPSRSVVQAPAIPGAQHRSALSNAAATIPRAAVTSSVPAPQAAAQSGPAAHPSHPTTPARQTPGRKPTPPPPTQPPPSVPPPSVPPPSVPPSPTQPPPSTPPPPALLSPRTTACDGTYRGTGRDVTVPSRATCVLEPGTTVTHDLTVTPGGKLVVSAATVGHDLIAQSPVGVAIAGGTIKHDLRIDGVSGSVTAGGNYVCGASVGHDLVIQGGLAGAGKLLVGGSCPGGGNTVKHDLVVVGNANAVLLGGNSVGHDLQTGSTGKHDQAKPHHAPPPPPTAPAKPQHATKPPDHAKPASAPPPAKPQQAPKPPPDHGKPASAPPPPAEPPAPPSQPSTPPTKPHGPPEQHGNGHGH